jgi:hypothetical protein
MPVTIHDVARTLRVNYAHEKASRPVTFERLMPRRLFSDSDTSPVLDE